MNLVRDKTHHHSRMMISTQKVMAMLETLPRAKEEKLLSRLIKFLQVSEENHQLMERGKEMEEKCSFSSPLHRKE